MAQTTIRTAAIIGLVACINIYGAKAFPRSPASSAISSFVGVTPQPSTCTEQAHCRPKSRLNMALTEEFIQMKVNGESKSDGSSSSEESGSQATATSKRERPLSDSIGYRALSTVQSLARVVGSDAGVRQDIGEGMGAVLEDEEDIDGFNRGAVGIAGVFSGKGPASRRTRVIEWQRRNLSDVRREVASYTPEMLDEGAGGNVEGGNGGANAGGEEGGRMTTLVDALPSSQKATRSSEKKDQTLIATALQTLEKDMALLDNLASSQPQLSSTEVGLLLGAVLASGMGPIFFPGTSVTEVLAPAAAAFTASITIGSEYIGRVAVADGKEIAANTIQCAAEAEAFLANAERVKAITPLCVGLGATAASLTLLTPTIIEALHIGNSVIMITELYLLCPLVSVLAAAVSNLALEETKGFCSRAINVGVRRFSKSGMVSVSRVTSCFHLSFPNAHCKWRSVGCYRSGERGSRRRNRCKRAASPKRSDGGPSARRCFPRQFLAASLGDRR